MIVTPDFDFSALSADQRLDLAQALWDSVLGTPDEPELDEEQVAELDRREALHDADPGRAIPWREAMDRLAKKHAR
jgi:putative addiction module component (TIGR02574 family)